MSSSDQVLPPDPNASGWHWLEHPRDGVQCVMDDASAGVAIAEYGWRHLCPVPPPARIAALGAEIGRLQVAFRVNAMRLGFTEAVIDEILFPDRPKEDEA